MTSLYSSPEAKREILDLYDQKLEELNISWESMEVDTSFGHAHVIATGPQDAPPIILVHGSNGCARIALETYPNLSEKFRVYAVDVPAQPNKSSETRPSMKDESYGIWMNEVIRALNIEKVTMVGFSFGGLVILKTLEQDVSKVKEVHLAAPAYIANGNPLLALFQMFIPMRKYMRTHNMKYVHKFLSRLFSEEDEFALNYLPKVFRHFSMDFSPVPVIRSQNANRITTPIHLYGAGNDLLFPGKKIINRARKIFPSLAESRLFDNSKHVLSRTDNDLIEKTIINNSSSSDQRA